MLPRKNFENLRAIMAILMLFEKFSGKFCLNFSALILSASPNMVHFVPTFSIMRACVLLSKSFKIQKSEKLYTSQTSWKMAGGWMHTPHPTPWIGLWP